MTFMQARWRLQLLAELEVGTIVRQVKRAEDEAVKKSLANLGVGRGPG